ncbi:putative adhesin protein mad1 protein [Daldinia childiae]|uniref:putative adhesin protein mad1 protein n=1 Tax=Daldinia childiae TaxID=326645 RepID=UPI0014484120|nr:putative adhesin protein mad1 protein [Daldinia childiae]KAF3061835.1 putative adhesin protein mad1 protein [Daldinia childiae]
MKYSFTLVTLAAGISQVTATGFFGFHNAPQFSCPDNTDNVCIPDIVKGIDWSDLPFGGFDAYKGFKWSGFTCGEKFGKRDELTARTFQSKCITGKAHQDKGKSPKISCDNSKGVKKTSIKKFQVSPEFDCDLEFHYTMPDGSACKHRSSCKASGTVVENTQCGGATDVTVVYPKQPSKPKDSCDFGIHHIDFDCEAPKPPKPSTPSSSSVVVSSSVSSSLPSSSAVVSSSSVAVSSSASYPASSLSTSSVAVSSSASESSVVASSSSASVFESTSSSSATTSIPIGVSSTVSVPAGSASTSAPTLPYPVVNSTTSATEATSSTADVSSFSVTSYLTTSTVFTTSVQTITSCGPSVPNCPAGSNTVVTVTVPLSTTICPVTETIGVSTPAVSTPATKPTESAAKPTESSVESTPTGPSGTSPASSSSSTPAGPVETLPCPNVVPSCLNTWMFSVGCKDNTDSACYCPDASFVKNIFTCLYAHGESDEVISEAISYFQGICAPFVPSNPGIATGADTITTILTATPTAPPAAVTTIEVATTVVVPCTNEAGETIPSSSSTVTISTSLTVPGIVFSTATNGPSSTGVVVVPGTYVATVPVATPTAETPAPTGAAPYPTLGGSSTLVTAAPSGTGVVYPTSAPSSSVIFTAGAAHVGAGMGLLGFAGMVVAAAL